MSAIASTTSSSGYSAVAQLLADGLSNPAATRGLPQIGHVGGSNTSGTLSSNPADSVDLSDHAKAVLAQAQKDQVLANELQTLLQSAKDPGGTNNTSASSQISGNGTQIFDQLTGQTPSQQQSNPVGQSLSDFMQADGMFEGLVAYARSLDNAHMGSDGTYASFTQTVQNATVAAPSTPQEVSSWYQSIEGQQTLSAAQYWPDNDPGLAAALTSHSVTFLNASEIPDLNFQNKFTIQDGEGGGSDNFVYTYNHNASIFSDPSTSYKVLGDGIVLAWKTPPGASATASS